MIAGAPPRLCSTGGKKSTRQWTLVGRTGLTRGAARWPGRRPRATAFRLVAETRRTMVVAAAAGEMRTADDAANGSAVTDMASNFYPNVWGDFFINFSSDDLQLQESEEWMKKRSHQLIETVRELFVSSNDVDQTMNLIDTLQHLGIDHHFKEEISSLLRHVHRMEFNGYSLHHVALRFRLLREHGFWVSPDEFNKFKGLDGYFSSEITSDPRGLLSLYNAAHLLIHGETILEEAILFSRHQMKAMISNMKSPLAEQVKRALQTPLPRTPKRVEAQLYISEYRQEKEHNTSILELAILDFNLLQRLHFMELKNVCEWWKDLKAELGMSYARDCMVECYFLFNGVCYEQEHRHVRVTLPKILALTSLLDDTYDSYATLEDGRKLNEAIQRWDLSCVSFLPEYLKKYYVKLLNTFREVEVELESDQKFHVAYCRKALQTISGHYFREAEWFHSSYMPSFKEHTDSSVFTCGMPILCVVLLVGMNDLGTEMAFKWAIGCTDAVKASGEVIRFMNDLAAFKNGKNNMDLPTTVECYISEHNVTDEEAIAKIESLVEDAWKTINQAYMGSGTLLPVLKRVANLTRTMASFYQNKNDAYTFSKYNKLTIEKLFVKPIALQAAYEHHPCKHE